MLDHIPTSEDMTALVGPELFDVWKDLNILIEAKYEMEKLWNRGGKAWIYEYKYRRGGKTLCSLYVRENCIGFMVIFGKDEQAKFEKNRDSFSKSIQVLYDETKPYHDGKWMMFEPKNTELFNDFIALLAIKRRPNRK